MCSLSLTRVQQAVEDHIQLAPLHNPPNLLGIAVAREVHPNDPRVAVFDTACHQTMPAHAFAYPIPYELYELNKKSVMLGVSGVSDDMRAVEQAADDGNHRAVLALDMFCYRIKKYVGAYTAALGDVHAWVLIAGVGKNIHTVRERVCTNPNSLGYKLDVDNNRGMRSGPTSPLSILVVASSWFRPTRN